MVRETKLSPSGGVEGYPLSPMQQGMLFHHLNGGGGVDIEQVICELDEEIHPAKLEQAWGEVIARHSALRTSFRWDDPQGPRQIVQPAAHVRLPLHHAEFGSENEARRGLEEYLAADRREGFRSLEAPLLRIALLRGGPSHFWFVTTYHHLLLDARSMTVMFREALELHDALVQGRRLELPPVRPYRAFIDWLQVQDTAGAERFWREHLRGFNTPTRLPVTRAIARAFLPDEAAGELAFRCDAASTAGLRRLAAEHDVTLHTVVQAAWSVVLARYTGEDDVVFGALRAGRAVPIEGAAAMVGLFINTVPVRVRLTSATAIGPWLRALREQWVAMRPFEHTSLMAMQPWSDVPAGQPLFETLLSFQEPAWDAALQAQGGAWANRRFDIRAQPSSPLALEVLAGEELTVKGIYQRSVFSGDAIARLLGHVREVLAALSRGGVATVGELPLLTATERATLLQDWNATEQAYRIDRCVHTLVEEQAARAPERIAVTDAENVLTYGELNARANRLACRLNGLGVGAESLVAVCMTRSTEMFVAWLGVLKAGGAFVPLDPAYPEDRLAFQLKDCGARVVLTQPALAPTLQRVARDVALVALAADGSGFATERDDNVATPIASSASAYVIYTSGSTGQPKGVVIEHRALLNLIAWHHREYAVTAADRATHLASPAFDAAIWEIWPYLTAGASVHIPSDDTRLEPARLWRWLADKKITLTFMPTPLAEAALDEGRPTELALRAVLTGGDTLRRRPPQGFPCRFINHYGPTESTVVATSAEIDVRAPSSARLPIGRPIANTQAYVLDRDQRLVPIGVIGELYLGGASLARGYLGRPELTAERFVPHPFSQDHGARLYRTGDLVRWTTRGELEFVGRVDGQVKVRGCRVELGEIEAALQQFPAVRESIVLARSDERGLTHLVAYVVPAAETSLDETALLDHLHAKLPSYMVPSAVQVLPSWPLTPNGKVDRRALPQPAARTSNGADAAALTATERAIAKAWREVLGREVGRRDDNFFDLGGHSLLAAQVVSRVNSALNSAVTVRVLFDQPTLADFAREVERQLTAPAARPTVPRVKRRVARPDLEMAPQQN